MFYEFRPQMFTHYQRARRHFLNHPDQLIHIEKYLTDIIKDVMIHNYKEIERDYNEASYLNAFWANYPPDQRGRSPVGDQIPWIEVGEHAVGHKLSRLLASRFIIAEIGLPSGADNRFVLYSKEIEYITHGFTGCAFVFLDIKSVGPRDNFNNAVISPNQVSGDGIWERPDKNLINSEMDAIGSKVSHVFYPAISPIYAFSDNSVAPTIHLFVKPVYKMLQAPYKGQPLESIKNICVPNGLLLTKHPNYLKLYPNLFYPGKDDKSKDPKKIRVRVSFSLLKSIAPWRVQEIGKV